MKKLKQIEKLQEIKELRRKLAELEVAKAMGVYRDAEIALQRALQAEADLEQEGESRTKKRLGSLMNQPGNVRIQSARVVNVYRQIENEKDLARNHTQSRTVVLEESTQNLRTQREKLARYLQVEERTRKLCGNLKAKESAEMLRKS